LSHATPYAVLTIHRIEDGKIVEEWERYDNLDILHQLGLVPEQK